MTNLSLEIHLAGLGRPFPPIVDLYQKPFKHIMNQKPRVPSTKLHGTTHNMTTQTAIGVLPQNIDYPMSIPIGGAIASVPS